VSRDAVNILDSLRPHLARAGLLSVRLRLERARTVVGVLEQVGLPAAVFQENGRLLALNPLLETLEGQFVLGTSNRIRLRDTAANALLQKAMSRRVTSEYQMTRSIPVPRRGELQPLIVHIIPVNGAARDILWGAMSLLVVTEVAAPTSMSTGLLNGLFDLTPAEARLASLIASGKSPQEAAVALGVSYETARTTLKRVFAKVGVSRQSELAALLTRLVL
jgi:DNA-binding CsgD family transcriptional regulator